jgi:hypothetical protein
VRVPGYEPGDRFSELDGIHLEAGEQEKLGAAVVGRVRELLE